MHELSHACGATDAGYFGNHGNWYGPPRDVENTAWSNIADTYSYWLRYGFCKPGVDCN